MEPLPADTWRPVSDRTRRRRIQRDLAALRASPEYRWLRRREKRRRWPGAPPGIVALLCGLEQSPTGSLAVSQAPRVALLLELARDGSEWWCWRL